MKEELLNNIIELVTLDLKSATEAALSTKSLAKSDEFKAESKWDTRGIEAGYLASAQERRMKEIEIELVSLNNLKSNLGTREYIGIGSLVETQKLYYFITALTGGLKLNLNGDLIQVVSASSPMAKKLINDEVEIINFC
jgi:hypothetical protein